MAGKELQANGDEDEAGVCVHFTQSVYVMSNILVCFLVCTFSFPFVIHFTVLWLFICSFWLFIFQFFGYVFEVFGFLFSNYHRSFVSLQCCFVYPLSVVLLASLCGGV